MSSSFLLIMTMMTMLVLLTLWSIVLGEGKKSITITGFQQPTKIEVPDKGALTFLFPFSGGG